MRTLDRLFPVRINDADHRVTTLELFFDLVYVFAFTQVTAWISREHSALGTLQGLLVLAILWWTWAAYAWMGNVMRADVGSTLHGFVAASAAVFVIAITIRHLWTADGGTLAPVAFAVAYVVIRLVHAIAYAWGARNQPRLLRQIGVTAAAWLPAAALVWVGALFPPQARLWWWLGTLTLDLAATWILAVAFKGWQVRSPGHFAERFQLIVILALGESVVAVGVASQAIDLAPELIATAVLGVVAAVALWWLYFKNVGLAVEHAIVRAKPARQVDLARDAYTYLHLPLVAGIVVLAAGVEEAVFALENHTVAGPSAVLIAAGSAVVCAAAAALAALVRRPWAWLASAAGFFVAGVAWMPSWNPLVAIATTAAVLSAVGAVTRIRA